MKTKPLKKSRRNCYHEADEDQTHWRNTDETVIMKLMKTKPRRYRKLSSLKVKTKPGIITESAKGWNKELNPISWNDRAEIRFESIKPEKMGKGITL